MVTVVLASGTNIRIIMKVNQLRSPKNNMGTDINSEAERKKLWHSAFHPILDLLRTCGASAGIKFFKLFPTGFLRITYINNFHEPLSITNIKHQPLIN